MHNEDNLAVPVSLYDKLKAYINSRDKVSKLSLLVAACTLLYGVVTAIIPPQWTLWVWQTVMSTFFLFGLGMFAWHETIGEARVMKPVYKLLYRLTGDSYYEELIKSSTKKVFDNEQ